MGARAAGPRDPRAPAPRGERGALPLAVFAAALFWLLDLRQIAFFNRYKASDLEDQDRQARYIARYADPLRPQRVAARAFTYGLTHHPVEVIWSLPRDKRELWALGSPWPRRRPGADDRGAEFLVWRRLY